MNRTDDISDLLFEFLNFKISMRKKRNILTTCINSIHNTQIFFESTSLNTFIL